MPEVINHTPDTMGYLAALGLQNGWGPTSLMQFCVESIHVATSTPWWGTVLISTIALRLLLFPIFIRVADNTARTKELQPFLLPFIERQRAAIQAGDLQSQQGIRTEILNLYKKAGVNPLWSFGGLIQIPFQFGTFIILRQMAYLPVPGLEHSGALWFTDLTSADPYFVMPVLSSLFIFLGMSLGAVDLPNGASQKVMKGIRIGLPLISLAITSTMPAMLTLYFLTTSSMGLLQAALFRSEYIRSKMGIYRRAEPEIAAPLKQQNLSSEALARIQADEATIKAENDRRRRESSGGIVSAALGSKNSITQGIKEHLKRNNEASMHKQYEKKAKEEDERRKKLKRAV
ncbi:hypothetical protein ABW20_dc0107155 [Dactylellina cionopaga]|nr:hypothetical protein ABW20_dc0107155 [Dactylellina cionopaga]